MSSTFITAASKILLDGQLPTSTGSRLIRPASSHSFTGRPVLRGSHSSATKQTVELYVATTDGGTLYEIGKYDVEQYGSLVAVLPYLGSLQCYYGKTTTGSVFDYAIMGSDIVPTGIAGVDGAPQVVCVQQLANSSTQLSTGFPVPASTVYRNTYMWLFNQHAGTETIDIFVYTAANTTQRRVRRIVRDQYYFDVVALGDLGPGDSIYASTTDASSVDCVVDAYVVT